MYYCGIDIAMKSSYIYITDSQGRKKTSGEIPTTAGTFRQRLRPYLRQGLGVAIEAGNQTAWIYDLLVERRLKRRGGISRWSVAGGTGRACRAWVDGEAGLVKGEEGSVARWLVSQDWG